MNNEVDIQSARRSKSDLLSELAMHGVDVHKPNAIRCPFHEDQHASAGVYCDQQGVWRFKCQAASCGVNADIYDLAARRTGKSSAEQFASMRVAMNPPRKPIKRFGSIDAWSGAVGASVVYRYTNPDTHAVDMLVARIDSDQGKRFTQARIDGSDVVCEAPAKPWPIYNRTRLRDHDCVIVAEGEKCVHALTKCGYTATTSPGGAGKAKYADWSPLAGKKVILWPDNDPIGDNGKSTGIEHMREVAEILRTLDPPCRLYWIDPSQIGVKDKGDAADMFADDETGDAICSAIDTAKPMGASGDVRQQLEDIFSGKRRAIDIPFRTLGAITQAFLPGTITVLCGNPGATKSLLTNQLVAYWNDEGIRLAVYMLEDDRTFHLRRMLAQLSGLSHLTDEKWTAENKDAARKASDEFASTIDTIGRFFFDAPDTVLKCEDALAWIRQVCSSGARIIVIDPVTALDFGAKPWESEKQFINEAKAILRRHGASMLCVTHGRGGKSSGNMLDDVSGSRAWGRFAHTVLWLQAFDVKRMNVRTPFGDSTIEANRTIRIAKARNGRGDGVVIAMSFDTNTLRFSEHGVVVKSRTIQEGDEE